MEGFDKRKKTRLRGGKGFSSFNEMGEVLQPQMTASIPDERPIQQGHNDVGESEFTSQSQTPDEREDTSEAALEDTGASPDDSSAELSRGDLSEAQHLKEQYPHGQGEMFGKKAWFGEDGALFLEKRKGGPLLRYAHGGMYRRYRRGTPEPEILHWDTNENAFVKYEPDDTIVDPQESALSKPVEEQPSTNVASEYNPADLAEAQKNLRQRLGALNLDDEQRSVFDEQVDSAQKPADVKRLSKSIADLEPSLRPTKKEKKIKEAPPASPVQSAQETSPVTLQLAAKRYADMADRGELSALARGDGEDSWRRDVDVSPRKKKKTNTLGTSADKQTDAVADSPEKDPKKKPRSVVEQLRRKTLQNRENMRRIINAFLKDPELAAQRLREELARGTVPPEPPEAPLGGAAGPEADPFPGRPEWAGKYFKNTDGTSDWYTFDRKAYGDLEVLTIEQIRANKEYNQLFGEFLTALHSTSEVYDRVAKNLPLNPEQEQFLDFAQHEFSRQMKRFDHINTELTSEIFKTLMNKSDAVRRLAQLSGGEAALKAYKKELQRLAVRDRGSFDRFASVFDRMIDPETDERSRRVMAEIPRLFRGFKMARSIFDSTVAARVGAREEAARFLGDELTTDALKQRMQREAFTGDDPVVPETEAGPKTRNEAYTPSWVLTEDRVQEYYERDKAAYRTSDGRGWNDMNQAERMNYRDHVWNPAEVKRHTESRALGLWAQMSAAFVRWVFSERKAKLDVKKDI